MVVIMYFYVQGTHETRGGGDSGPCPARFPGAGAGKIAKIPVAAAHGSPRPGEPVLAPGWG
jgi:hypothetical protein